MMVNEFYQKIAYIALRNSDGTFLINVPLYVKLNVFNKNGMSDKQEELMHRITEIMMKHYEKQINEFISNVEKEKKYDANIPS